MPYLRVECGVCHCHWDYYDEKVDYEQKYTPIEILGCVCPICGSIGFIRGGSDGNIKGIPEEAKK